MALTVEELKWIVDRLRRQGSDDGSVEVKTSKNELSKDIWETVSAFGNTHGGLIILGLEENNHFKPVKGFKLEKVRDQFVSGMGDGGGNGRMANAPQYTLDRMDFEGGQVLFIEINEVEANQKPCYIRDRGVVNGSYKRIDDKDIRLSTTEIYELQQIFEPSLADQEPVAQATMDDLDGQLIDGLIAGVQERSPRALRGAKSRKSMLERLNVVDKQGSVLFAGLISLGAYPQQFFPKLVIDVAAHPGTEKSDPAGPRFLDRVVCEGPVGEAIEEAVKATAKNLRTISRIEGTGRKDEYEIPIDVLREAIVNAAIHREYSKYFIGQAVSVDIFSDRVEIMNPGGLWGGKTLESIGDGQSRCRNAALMQLVRRIDYRGQGSPAEGQGSGIPLMISEMRSHALDEPHFEAGIDYFKVTLQRGGVEIEENRKWVEFVTHRELNSLESSVLLAARQSGQVTVKGVHEKLGYDSDEIRNALISLEQEGLLTSSGKDCYAISEILSWSVVSPSDMPTKYAIMHVVGNAEEPVSIRQIAEATGRKLPTLRAQLNRLVKSGEIVPTAATTNRDRKYRLPQ